jgi:hypothetical protein
MPCLAQIGLAWAHLAEARGADRLSRNELLVQGWVQRTNDLYRTAVALNAAAVLVVGVLFIIWMHRCYTNLQALGERHFRYTPAWTMTAWFVPIMSWVVPCQILVDLRLAMAGQLLPARMRTRRSHRADRLTRVWWELFVISQASAVVMSFKAFGGDSSASAHRFAIAAALVGAVAAILAMVLVRGTTRGISERAKKLAQMPSLPYSHQPPPPPPPLPSAQAGFGGRCDGELRARIGGRAAGVGYV